MAKFLAFGLTFFAFFPAIIQLIIGAIVPVEDFTFVAPEEFFGTIQVILVLFVAAMASELVGNDRKNNTLVLYFSRPIEKEDYVLAKVGALAIALLALTLRAPDPALSRQLDGSRQMAPNGSATTGPNCSPSSRPRCW